MLFAAGMVNRLGRVDDGTTVTDYDDEEIARKHTLSAQSLAYAEWNKTKINLHRHPWGRQLLQPTRAPPCGSPTPRSSSSMPCPASTVQTEKAWAAADELGLPRIVALNRLDRERASLERTHRESLRRTCDRERRCPIHLPIGEERGLHGPGRRRRR